MALTHIVVLTTALLTTLVCLPRVVAAVVRPESFAVRRAWIQRARQDAAAHRSLDRLLGLDQDCGSGLRRARPDLCIEQLAADLRRLGRERANGLSGGSRRWQAAVLVAYDDRLQLASAALGVTQRLAELEGIDRDLERLRIEEELQAAGLKLR